MLITTTMINNVDIIDDNHNQHSARGPERGLGAGRHHRLQAPGERLRRHEELHLRGGRRPRRRPYYNIAITIIYYAVLYCAILCYTILCYTILHYTTLYYTILYDTIRYYTILYYTICSTMLYYTKINYDTTAVFKAWAPCRRSSTPCAGGARTGGIRRRHHMILYNIIL